MAFDSGQKRTGIAVTDPGKMIANGLGTFPSATVEQVVSDYLRDQEIECFVVGLPKTLMNQPAESMPIAQELAERLRKRFQGIPVEFFDERFTSSIAFQTMIDAGISKKARRNKALVDEISAVILLQDFLSWKGNQRNSEPGEEPQIP